MIPVFFILVVIAAILIFISIVVVRQQTVVIIERLGKYNRALLPGLGWRIPIIERVAARVSLQVQEIDVQTQTLTADNLFVELGTSLQIRVLADQVYDAHYQLENPYQQITSWTLNSLRTIVSQVSIADLYKDHASIEQSIQDEVATKLARYGYEIVACLIKSIQPSEEVQHSFNRVAAAERERAAAELEGEAFKIKLVKEAQAHAEAAKLAGQGIAQQRQEIAKGFSEAIATVKRGVDGSVDEFTIMGVLMASASFETIRDAARSQATVILMPYGAEGAMRQVADVATALRAGLGDAFAADQVGRMTPDQEGARRDLLVLTAAWVIGLALSFWIAADRMTWVMEVLPAIIALPLLWTTRDRLPFSTMVYGLVAVHGLILMLGGAYTYAKVPLGFWIQDAFHMARNPYDRIGHFAQGFVPAFVARELLLRRFGLPRGKLLGFLVVCICLAISAAYELIEWRAAVAMGQGADAFLGTQGDPWDTQEDMATALVAAIIAMVAFTGLHDRAIAARLAQRPTLH